MTGEAKTVCKVRGITINYKSSQIVNFDTIKDLVFNGRSYSTVTVGTDKIKRKRIDGACVSIVTEPDDKTYRVSFFKRRTRIIRPYPSAINKLVLWRERHFV